MLEIIILFLSVILSAILVDRFRLNEKLLQLLLAFSGAYLLTVAFTHIIPNIFKGNTINYLGYFVLLGFLIQLFIEYLSGGAEHGHGHCDDDHDKHNPEHSSVRISPYALLIGISIHAFFEGIPFANQFHNHAHLSHTLLVGIVIHKIPIAVILMSLFLNTNSNKVKNYFLITLFALAAPLGALLGGYIGVILNVDIENFYKIIMAILVGIFLHVSTTILFESNTTHKFNLLKLIIIFIGILVAILTNLL